MTFRLIPLVAVVALAATAAPAHAAGAVYGGTTSGSEPIVITAGKAAKKLTSAVVGWSAACDDGMRFPVSQELTPAADEPSFSPGSRDLVMTRNAKGRFAGTSAAGFTLTGAVAASSFRNAGRLARGRGSGTLSATVKITDSAGNALTSCQTGIVHWAATRAPGKVLGGRTSQEEPVVVRLDSTRRLVKDLMLTWESQSCTPPALIRFPERFRSLAVARSGAFGAPFREDDPFSEGSKASFAYRLAGRVTRTAIRARSTSP